jgi:RNA polymerase sigma-70 factor (ECF subfamily)
MEATDAAAVAAVQAGERDAFRLLVERHSHNIFKLAYRMTANEHDAEEVVQETFLRAYRRIGDFESRANFSTWLYRIGVNCALDLLARRNQQQRTHDPLFDEEERELPIASANPTPERLVLSSELKHKIQGAMQALTPVERTAFVLRHFEGQSIEEIGKTLNLRANATKNSIFRAVQKMRRALEPMMRPAV